MKYSVPTKQLLKLVLVQELTCLNILSNFAALVFQAKQERNPRMNS